MSYQTHTTHGVGDTDGQRPCARGDRCLEADFSHGPDGMRVRQGALGYRALCDSDRTFLLTCVEALPGYYEELADRIGDKSSGHGEKVSGSREAPIPINVTVDELMVELVNVIASWAGRVEHVARLTSVFTDGPLRAAAGEPVALMCQTLAAHLDVLLALTAEPMTRFVTLADAAKYAAAGVPGHVHPHAGYAEVTPDLSGADAGLEIIKLNGRCRWLLGYTGKDDRIGGRCLSCEQLDVLIRPDGAAGLADHAECSACGARYYGDQYRLLMRDVYEQEIAHQKEAS